MGLCCCTSDRDHDHSSEIQTIKGIKVNDVNRQFQDLHVGPLGSRNLIYPNKEPPTGFDHPAATAVPMTLHDSPPRSIHRTRLPYWAAYSLLDDTEQADLCEPEVELDGDLEPQECKLWQDGYTTATLEHETKLRVALAALCLLLLATAGGGLVVYAVWRAQMASAAGADKPQSTAAEAVKATALPRVDDAERLSSFDCLQARPVPADPSVQLWCCLHRNVLCPAVTTTFNCSVGFTSWALSWSLAKKDWCCLNEAVACPDDAPPSSAASVSQTLSSGFTSARPVVSNTVSPSPAPLQAIFNCSGFQLTGSAWSPSRREWCCDKVSVGC